MWNRISFVLLASLLLVQGCSNPVHSAVEKVGLATDLVAYQPGDTLVARLTNDGEDRMGYWWCGLVVERREGDGWRIVPPPPLLCITVLSTLEGGEHAELRWPLDEALPAGNYRLRIPIYPNHAETGPIINSGIFAVGTP